MLFGLHTRLCIPSTIGAIVSSSVMGFVKVELRIVAVIAALPSNACESIFTGWAVSFGYSTFMPALLITADTYSAPLHDAAVALTSVTPTKFASQPYDAISKSGFQPEPEVSGSSILPLISLPVKYVRPCPKGTSSSLDTTLE